jgi:hypothetical protein
MMIKVETRVSAQGGTSAADSESINTYYVRGDARRHDMVSPLGSHTAVIKYCDTGTGYFVDFDRKEYYKLSATGHLAELGSAPTGSPQGKTVVVTSETTEVGEPRKILGHLARHFITRVEEPVADSGGAQEESKETIDGWYLTDVQEPSTSCAAAGAADQPSWWIGAPVLPEGSGLAQFQHTGPTPKGLAVKVTRTSGHDRTLANGRSGGTNATILDREVVEFSDSTLDPVLFEVPREFREVAKPRSADR